MGFMVLEEFRDAVKQVAGAAGMGNWRVDRWINQAYFEVCARTRHDKLLNEEVIATVDGTYKYPLNTRTQGVRLVYDLTSKRRLLAIGLDRFYIKDSTIKEHPKYWATDGRNLLVNPTPMDAHSINVIAWWEPVKLSEPGSTTVLDSDLDVIIENFAKYLGLQNLGRKEESLPWFIKASDGMNKRISDAAELYEGETANVDIAWSEEDLYEME